MMQFVAVAGNNPPLHPEHFSPVSYDVIDLVENRVYISYTEKRILHFLKDKKVSNVTGVFFIPDMLENMTVERVIATDRMTKYNM